METNIQTKKTVRKVSAKTEVVKTDPFETAVEEIPVKKRVTKKAAAAAGVTEKNTGPLKKAVRKNAKNIISDPFAEIAVDSSPVKKRAVKTVKTELKEQKKAAKRVLKRANLDETAEIAATEPSVQLSPVFKALADVSLPELPRENRARLQMQTPTRLYFYWSIKENPWALIRSVFGDDLGSYTLVVKLIDKRHETEKIQQCEAEGSWWFDVDPDHTYQAEIGFYAPNRPYFRVLHSNTVETPRRSPSPRVATASDWKITAKKFAEVLDVAGFSRDAFDVVMAGDDPAGAENTSQLAFSRFLEDSGLDFNAVTAEDIRYAMLALASGCALEDLRGKIGPALFAMLQANAEKLVARKAMSALTEYFDIDEAEFTEEQSGTAVYGASLINFPRTLKSRTVSSYNPVSSHSFQ